MGDRAQSGFVRAEMIWAKTVAQSVDLAGIVCAIADRASMVQVLCNHGGGAIGLNLFEHE